MGKRIKIDELRELLEKAIAREAVIQDLRSDLDDPQVRMTRNMSQARMEAFTSVYEALRGNAALLRIHAGN